MLTDLITFLRVFLPTLLAAPRKGFFKRLKSHRLTLAQFGRGAKRFIYGLAKKVLVADVLATVADAVFGTQISSLNMPLAWVGAVCFMLQIFFELSGYADMIIGIGAMLGFTLPESFNLPYLAGSVTEFWQRWEMALTGWLREHLYLPLAGKNKNKLRQGLGLGATFIVIGMWHGLGWNFVVWGLWHGLFVLIEWLGLKKVLKRHKLIGHFYALLVVLEGWVIFRSPDLSAALQYLRVMLYGEAAQLPLQLYAVINHRTIITFVVALLLIGIWQVAVRRPKWLEKVRRICKICVEPVVLLGLLALCVLSLASSPKIDGQLDLPFREQLQQAWVNVNFFALGDITNSNVVANLNAAERSDSWLFYAAADDGDAVIDAQGLHSMSNADSNATLQTVVENTATAAEKGADLYYLLVPNKENIYRDKLPWYVEIYNENSRVDNLMARAAGQGVNNLIYPKAELAAASDTAQTYYKQDTRWNDFGAFVGFRAVMNATAPWYADFNYALSDTDTRPQQLDLEWMAGLDGYFTDSYPQVSYRADDEYLAKSKRMESGNYLSLSVNGDAPIKQTLLVVGDAYSTAMQDYFFKTYRKCIFVHRYDYNPEMLETYHPDTIILEFAERKVGNIKDLKL